MRTQPIFAETFAETFYPQMPIFTRFVRLTTAARGCARFPKVFCFEGLTLAGEPGFEPRQTESESVVLPLHHSPTKYLFKSTFFGNFARSVRCFAKSADPTGPYSCVDVPGLVLFGNKAQPSAPTFIWSRNRTGARRSGATCRCRWRSGRRRDSWDTKCRRTCCLARRCRPGHWEAVFAWLGPTAVAYPATRCSIHS